MRTNYEIHCGRRLVSHQAAHTAREAIREYLRSMGCREEEMSTYGPDTIRWNGAVYRAVAEGVK